MVSTKGDAETNHAGEHIPFFNLFYKKENLNSNIGNHNITFGEVGYIFSEIFILN